ncbi:MAG: hypothetical protein HYY06_31640 [Deltaproteobacteria bacterium]|nr:hypothetical protein [Deltaproteobacteria bacterium]
MQRLLVWWWLALPAVAVTEIALQRRIESNVPRTADWAAAASIVRQGHRDSDLVVVAPEWASQVARVHLGERLQPLEAVARADTSRFGRLWVVSIRGARSPEETRARLEKTWQRGLVTVRLLRLGEPAQVAFDFVLNLHRASVRVESRSRERPCPWAPAPRGIGGGRFRCGPGWNHVGVEILDDLDRRPHLAIWAHPVRDGRLVVEFADVPMGEILSGHMGLRYEAAKRLENGPVRLTVEIDGGAARSFTERDADSWRAFTVPTGELAGRRARVRFSVAAREPGMRHFYFAADTRSGP